MDNFHRIAFAILAIVNIAAFFIYGWDKFCAKQGWRRVPEKILLLLALVGGSAGAMAAMALFRHKTRHLKFRYGVPLIFLSQVGFCLWLHGKA